MKKFILSFVLMLGIVGLIKYTYAGESRSTPYTTDGIALISSDYGGVNYSTSSFTSNITTVVLSGKGIVYGAIFSTGNISSLDYVEVYDSSGPLQYMAIQSTNTTFARFFNVNGSTTAPGSLNGAASGFSGPIRPIRFKQGLFWKVSTNVYNFVTLLYYAGE
mgnify:FL=1